jgi:hypothetical protein
MVEVLRLMVARRYTRDIFTPAQHAIEGECARGQLFSEAADLSPGRSRLVHAMLKLRMKESSP